MGSQRRQTPGDTGRRPATNSPANWLFRRHQATSRDSKIAPYKRGVTGSNPVAPTRFPRWKAVRELEPKSQEWRPSTRRPGGCPREACRSPVSAWSGPSGTPKSGTWSAGTWRPWSRRLLDGAGRPSKSLTLEQAQELLRAAAGCRPYAYVVLSATTGLRTEELRALRWKEVDLDAGTVVVYRAVRATADTKTPKSRRVLSRPRLAVRALGEHRARQAEDRLLAGALWQDHGLVFTSAIGMALDRHNVLREFRKITQAAGLCID
jgi:hypothetical protein